MSKPKSARPSSSTACAICRCTDSACGRGGSGAPLTRTTGCGNSSRSTGRRSRCTAGCAGTTLVKRPRASASSTTTSTYARAIPATWTRPSPSTTSSGSGATSRLTRSAAVRRRRRRPTRARMTRPGSSSCACCSNLSASSASRSTPSRSASCGTTRASRWCAFCSRSGARCGRCWPSSASS